MPREYALTPKTDRAVQDAGLANPNWYRSPVDPADIRTLMVKEDARPLRDLGVWLGLLIATAWAGIALWGTWWSVPFWIAYGVLYGSASDARWHECGHQTAFKTQWLNSIVYHIASFMLFRNPYVWRASHVRHHTDTIIVGRDPEIQAMRPPDLARILFNLFGIPDGIAMLRRMVDHAFGRLSEAEMMYVRDADHQKVFRTARITLCIHALVGISAIVSGSILPLMLIGLPTFYGAWQRVMTGSLQHLGLAENVTDHRLNTRTVLMDPINRFLYLNMNYHVEHHMFTMVPYYNLPKLHELIGRDLPVPEPGIFAAYRRMVPVLIKQLRQHQAVIVPPLPTTAQPYRAEVEVLRPFAA